VNNQEEITQYEMTFRHFAWAMESIMRYAFHLLLDEICVDYTRAVDSHRSWPRNLG
jgi:hypothetical protein